MSFAPEDATRFLVSSWDSNVYLYEIATDGEERTANILKKYPHKAPVLDVCFGANDNEAFTAGMDWLVKRYDEDDYATRVLLCFCVIGLLT